MGPILGGLKQATMYRWNFGGFPGNNSASFQGGPLLVIHRVITPINGLINGVTGVITLLIGIITPFITGRGPPCWVGVIFHDPCFQFKFRGLPNHTCATSIIMSSLFCLWRDGYD